jgi:hypothetical protein
MFEEIAVVNGFFEPVKANIRVYYIFNFIEGIKYCY